MVVSIGVTKTIENDSSYQFAIHYIRNHDKIRSIAGENKDFDLTSGSVRYSNGHGHASFKITVDGEHKDVHVSIELSKEPSEKWVVEDISY